MEKNATDVLMKDVQNPKFYDNIADIQNIVLYQGVHFVVKPHFEARETSVDGVRYWRNDLFSPSSSHLQTRALHGWTQRIDVLRQENARGWPTKRCFSELLRAKIRKVSLLWKCVEIQRQLENRGLHVHSSLLFLPNVGKQLKYHTKDVRKFD